MFLEAIGAYFSKSIAILTDCVHLLSDLMGFTFSLISIYLTSKHPTYKKSFGYIRAEILGALLSIFIIWGMTLWVGYEAI